jgi:hypothetical protein
MTRDEVFPSKYLKAADLKGKAYVATIESAPHPHPSTFRFTTGARGTTASTGNGRRDSVVRLNTEVAPDPLGLGNFHGDQQREYAHALRNGNSRR